MESPQLWIKSRRAPEPEGFVEHSSRLDDASTKPIFALWREGEIKKIFLGPDETPSSANLKRGLTGIFQYRTLDGVYRERDASGWCNTSYVSHGPRILEKQKNSCDDSGLQPKNQHPNPILDVSLTSVRRARYELNSVLLPSRVDEYEQHEVSLSAKPEVGTKVTSQRILKEIPTSEEVRTVQARTEEEAVANLQPGYRQVSIDLQIEPVTCPDSGCRTVTLD